MTLVAHFSTLPEWFYISYISHHLPAKDPGKMLAVVNMEEILLSGNRASLPTD
jgi:hypothetical protein